MAAAAIICLLLLANAFYVAAEYSVVGVRRARVRQLSREGRRAAHWLEPIVSDPRQMDRAITACQIGISASSVILGAVAQHLVAPRLSPHLGAWVGPTAALSVAVAVILAGVSIVQVILCEQVPKSIAVRDPERWALRLVHPLRLSRVLMAPFIVVLTGAAGMVLWLLRLPRVPRHSLHSPAEIGWLVARSARRGALERDLGERLRGTIRFAGRCAADVMVPRVRMRAVPEQISLADLRRTIRETGHTRLPVFRGTLDDITGVIHAKDIFLESNRPGAPPLRPASIVRPVLSLPWSAPAVNVLETMRTRHAAIAVVLDEHGGTAGIVTLEDLVEEIVGDLEDEFDVDGPAFGALPDGRLRLRAEDSIAWVNARYGLSLRSRQARTVGGVVMEGLARVARPGDRLRRDGLELEVERMRGRRIETVLLMPPHRRQQTAVGDAGAPGGESGVDAKGDPDGGDGAAS